MFSLILPCSAVICNAPFPARNSDHSLADELRLVTLSFFLSLRFPFVKQKPARARHQASIASELSLKTESNQLSTAVARSWGRMEDGERARKRNAMSIVRTSPSLSISFEDTGETI